MIQKILSILLILLLIPFYVLNGLPHAEATSIVGSNINNCASGSNTCSVTVPSGATTYFYVAATGGEHAVSAADFGQDLGVIDDSAVQAIVIGHSSSNTGTVNTNGALVQSIGGIGVIGSPSQIIPFQNSGVNTISGNFNLPQDSLVVLLSASSGRVLSPISLSAPFTIDQQTAQQSSLGIVIAHAILTAGSQEFSLTYSTNISPTPDNVIGVVLYIFPTILDTTSPVLTVPSDFSVLPTSPKGAVVTFVVTAKDPDDAASTAVCNPSSGSTFAIGMTTVTCTSTDTHSNTGTASFHVTVLTPAQGIQAIINLISGANLGGITNSFDSQLSSALTSLNSGLPYLQ